jgi:hypothetical protein
MQAQQLLASTCELRSSRSIAGTKRDIQFRYQYS